MPNQPVSALDVAQHILRTQGYMSTMKLQKLVYYSQAWSLAWDGEPLFREEVRAWRDGPVVRELYDAHKGRFVVDAVDIGGEPAALDDEQRKTVDAILRDYGRYDGQALSDQTHKERPWLGAREGFEPSEYSDVVISHEAMREYYGSL